MSNTRDLQENINDLKALLLSAEQDANKLKAQIQETDEKINNLNKPVIDYHSQINISNIEFERKDELADCVSELIENVFNVIPD